MLGTLEVTCSRCLDQFDFPVDDEETLYIKLDRNIRKKMMML
jgi:uncharacterized metal-binding protein YceD (DUF177 family)